MTPDWLRIQRVLDFWNFPHWLTVYVKDSELVYLHNEFDPVLDDYGPMFDVYLVPPGMWAPLSGPWGDLHKSFTFVGRVPVADVEFDSTKHLSLSSPELLRLLTEWQQTQIETEC